MKQLTFIFFFILLYSCSEKENLKLPESNEFEIGNDYNFIIKENINGDFNGDGSIDKLTETIISSVNNQSINQLPSNVEYDSLVEIMYLKKPILSLKSNDEKIPELFVNNEYASFGFLWIKNEGDLNNDGGDEISIVVDWADWSQINYCVVYSLQKNKWVKLMSFQIREWQLRDKEEEKSFQGFISKTKSGEYLINTFDSEVNEIQVPLNKMLDPNN